MQQSGMDLSLHAKQQHTILHSKIDKDKLTFSTIEKPRWIHFGANDGCMLPAYFMQNLVENDGECFGIILAEPIHYANIEEIFIPYDNIGLCLTKKNNKPFEKRIINTVVESLKADHTLYPQDWERLVHIFRNPSLQVVSLSIYSNAYIIYNSANKLISCYDKDCRGGPAEAQTELGKITALCYERFLAGEYPLALVSFDDCSRNGSKLNEAVVRIAREWEERGKAASGFSGWLNEPEIIAFPWTKIVKADNCMSAENIIESFADEFLERGKKMPPLFILDESFKVYIEDDFPNGRFALEKTGVVFASRDEILSVS